MSRFISILLVSLLLLTSCQFQNEEGITPFAQDEMELLLEQERGKDYDRTIILFRDDIEEDVIEGVDGVVLKEADIIKMASAYLPKDEVNKLKNHPNIISIEKDQVVQALNQDTTWGYEQILTPRSYNSGLRGKGIKISIIDTGIAPHYDLSIAGGQSFVDYTNSYSDDNGHGTHIAGIIAALDNNRGIIGVAPEAEIYALKVLNQNGLGYLSDIIAAIDWSVKNNMDIINLSLGLYNHSTALNRAVDNAYNSNILLVAAGGNDGNPNGTGDNVAYPARYNSTIAIAATDTHNRRANFSATGSLIEQSAPGVAIYSTYLNNTYTNMNGTSMATPFAAGVLALIKQANPRLSANELRNILNKTSIDLGQTGRNAWYGFGLVQSPVFLTDISNHWAYKDIVEVFHFGWMRGTREGTFSPELNLTRAQAAAILVRALDLDYLEGDLPTFHDIEGHWAQEEMEIISQHRYIRGIAENTFSPDTTVTREQMAAILVRILNLNRTDEMENPFIDVNEGHWAADDVITATYYKIFRGLTHNTFGGEAVVTRAQMAALMNRISDQIT
ncbi:S8 family serine peptidase [Bacillus shivajii]|uniref:S8 family peptidase n=1 Tax=Bacillus shivajii TaxID=1983719 RepID=UPI001CFBF06F|nr:S8 family serine peptidase [Bacillus shivajii]UCZ51446.1 S8 family serine peptidase [Bacillus shivajii]